MRKRIAIFSITILISFAACGKAALTAQPASSSPLQELQSQFSSHASGGIKNILFPAYELQSTDKNSIIDIETVNHTPAFTFSFPLPEGWEIKTEKGDETPPTGVFYTPVYLYENEKMIGYIAFSPFEFEVPEDVPKDEAYPYLFPSLRLGSQVNWDPYTLVKEIENGSVGVVDIYYMDPNDIANHPGAMPDVDQLETIGIVAYDLKLNVSVAVAFMPDTISKKQATEIAEQVVITSVKNSG